MNKPAEIATSDTVEISTETVMYLLVCTFRYSLGRMTPAVNECVRLLRVYWRILPDWMRAQIKQDIVKAIHHGRAGMSCDVGEWRRVLDFED